MRAGLLCDLFRLAYIDVPVFAFPDPNLTSKLEQRAKQGERTRYLAALAQVPDISSLIIHHPPRHFAKP